VNILTVKLIFSAVIFWDSRRLIPGLQEPLRNIRRSAYALQGNGLATHWLTQERLMLIRNGTGNKTRSKRCRV
jgi:hypothetical protein